MIPPHSQVRVQEGKTEWKKAETENKTAEALSLPPFLPFFLITRS
jgi:hypothetical protein